MAELVELADVIDKLVSAGVNTTEPGGRAVAAEGSAEAEQGGASGPVEAGPLAGKSVVVTGSMTGALAALSRNEMNDLIEKAGGRAASGVSTMTSLVVAGDKAGSKRAKAEGLGIEIITPEEFATLVGPVLDDGATN